MDILLTHGYFIREDPHEESVMKPYPPLGILYLAAWLEARGFSVGVFDGTFSSPAQFAAALARERPAAVGIYGTLMTRFHILRMIGEAKAAGAAVILGGPEPAAYSAEYLEHGADVVVFGEGELTLDQLIREHPKRGVHRLGEVAGIAYRREDGSIGTTQPRPLVADLDSLPEPARHRIAIPEYLETWRRHHGAGSLSLICSRGCPYRCEWCSHAVYGHTHRRRSPARVADEVAGLLDAYRPDQLWYADDVFTIHHGWLSQYAAELKRRGIRVPFECISRADRLNEAVADVLAEMGCERMWIGSESGSQRVLDAMKRDVRVEEVQSAMRILRRRGIQTGMFIMLGYEGEEMSDLAATVEHLTAAQPDQFLTTVAYPIRGTAYHDRIVQRVVRKGAWDTSSDRDLAVRGRRSRRFYSFAARWMASRVAFRRELAGRRMPLKLARAAVNIAIGRAGMEITKHEVEA